MGLVILLAFIVEHLVGKPIEVALLGVNRFWWAGGSPVVHAVVKKTRDPLAGAFEV